MKLWFLYMGQSEVTNCELSLIFVQTVILSLKMEGSLFTLSDQDVRGIVLYKVYK